MSQGESSTSASKQPLHESLALQTARMDLEALTTQLKDLYAEIDAKVVEQSTTLRTRSNADSRKALEDEIEALEEEALLLEKHLVRLRESIKRLEKERGHISDGNGEGSTPPPQHTSITTSTYLVPKMLPTAMARLKIPRSSSTGSRELSALIACLLMTTGLVYFHFA